MNSPEPVLVRQGSETVKSSLKVEVFLDFVCPWCLIGARHLDTAASRLAELRPDVQLQVVWCSYPLLPDTPVGGLPYQAFYVNRLGSPEAVAMRRAQVQQAGTAAGIRFAFDRIGVLPNTAATHALLAQAAVHGTDAQQARLIQRIFTAYFMEGEDIGNTSVLKRLALECGLDAGDAQAGIDPHVPARLRYPISGVPCFVLDESFALSGAASPDALLDLMLRALDA
ncbi:DsbA family oxidoreductase [Variovorax sp. J22R133]|uniref:DsbA family oxidoreductase n=1 Tax=Variovorax brevis TaxID=3053503 RepID=UPI00257784E0|nr:DsbA family oxidoreductase [Variovorax sp. J22R133]MDM0110828.1 DsbA family oxidoreductase [Variovorax sp. J22R133]